MTWLENHYIQLTLVLLYLAVLAHHAMVGRRHANTLTDYLVAGRGMGGFVIAMSFYATFMSTNTFIGAAGKSWNVGLTWCLGGIVLSALACVSWFVIAPRFVPLTRQYSSLTLPDFLGTHYNSRAVRRVACGITVFSSVLYLVAIYQGAALSIEAFFEVPYAWSLVGVFIVVTLYTMVGGFESVVLTDTFQGMIMLAGAVVLFVSMLAAGGGPVRILHRLDEIDPSLASWTSDAALAATMAYSLAVGMKFLVEPRQLTRFYGLKDSNALRQARWISPGAILITYACLLPLGAMARTILAPDAIQKTDQVVPHLLGNTQLIGPVVSSLFLLVLISAAMSSIDSVLLVVGSTIDRDLIRLAPPEEGANTPRAVGRTRLWILIVSIVATAGCLLPFTQDIIEMTTFSGSLYGACFLPALLVGLYLRSRNAWAAILTMLAGSTCVVTAFVLRETGYTKLEEVYPGVAVGMLVFLLAHWLLPTRGEQESPAAP